MPISSSIGEKSECERREHVLEKSGRFLNFCDVLAAVVDVRMVGSPGDVVNATICISRFFSISCCLRSSLFLSFLDDNQSEVLV